MMMRTIVIVAALAIAPAAAGQGTVYVGGMVDICATATDAGAGVRYVRFFVDNELIQETELPADDVTGQYPVETAPCAIWDASGHPEGPHQLTASAEDGAGNTSVSMPVQVIVDNSAPTISAPAVSIPIP